MRGDFPTGTVTFLFTDVEGSTKLLDEIGDEAYDEALAEHRRIVRSACAAAGGVEVDTQGDAFFFAFPTAPGALAAASEMTSALASGPVQVRIGLHTGKPRLSEEGYIGKEVHFAARVAASGHGGQIILSKATAELIDDSLTDLGEHQLKDIEQAVSIFQLGEKRFPPLKTISNTNLPRPVSSFVGREQELDGVLGTIEQGARLVTLTGPGGSGKSRLALEVAASLVPSYKAGVFWVGLATLRDSALVSEQIAQTLGARNGLAEHIGEREMLLLLDNLEQVIEAAPDLSRLLQACPNLTLLCTSRELLRVQGEVEYEVPPLASLEAVSLFCERSGLQPSEDIAELCARLDNLPLAVELAAARTKALTPAQILERLSSRLDLLKGGRDADPRQQTLRATIAWSYDLLSEEEQRLFRALSVFAGGCTLEAAEEVADVDLDTLQSLVEKSLLRFSDGRYWMLETLRVYAVEQLRDSSEAKDLRERHFAHFLTLSETAGTERSSDRRDLWIDRLELERENVRTALLWAQEANAAESTLQLAVAFSWFWLARGPLAEALRWLESAVAAALNAPLEQRAVALQYIAGCSIRLGDAARAYRAADESLTLYRQIGNDREIAMALEEVGESLSQLGDISAAKKCFGEAVELLREQGTDLEVGRVLISRGYLELSQGAYHRAAQLFEEGLERMRRTSRPGEIAYALVNLGSARLMLGDVDAAEAHLHESCRLYRSVTDTVGYAYSIEALGVLKGRLGVHDDGVSLLGAADRIFRENSVAMQSFELNLHDTAVRALKEILGATAFADAWSRGADLTDDGIAAMVERAAASK